MRALRWIFLPLWGTFIAVRMLLGTYRRSRREGIDFGEALKRSRDELQAEIDEEAAREKWRRDLMKDMPPPP